MEEAIRNFPKQFAWEPELQNASVLERREIVIVAGMGGSHLAADILQSWDSSLDIVVHSDYGLSGIPESVLRQSMVVAISYSGNTEETLSAFQEAVEKHIPLCAISIGGKLLDLAKAQGIPYAQIPNTGIQPRMGIGFLLKALLKCMGQEKMLAEVSELALQIRAADFEKQGQELSSRLQGKIPVVYASARNKAIAYIWKITLNETSKIPAFYNMFSELNHNEMTGFDVQKTTKELSNKFHFIFLKDDTDHPQIQKRMEALKKLYEDRGLLVEVVRLQGSSTPYKIFSSLLLADWTSLHLARYYAVDPDQVPMVEEFKKLIS